MFVLQTKMLLIISEARVHVFHISRKLDTFIEGVHYLRNIKDNVRAHYFTLLFQPEAEDGRETESCGGSGELTLEGAQARLESLKENLYKREREITELLQGEREMEREQTLITAIRIPCTALLRTVIQKVMVFFNCTMIYTDIAGITVLYNSPMLWNCAVVHH